MIFFLINDLGETKFDKIVSVCKISKDIYLFNLKSKNLVYVCSVVSNSFVTPWIARLLCAWNFPQEEYWSRWPFPPPRNLSDPEM